MNPLTFAGKAVDLSYKALNVASGAVYIIDSIKYKKILRRNKKFKNIHEGETCFILGNGPSINLLDVMSYFLEKIVNVTLCLDIHFIEKYNTHLGETEAI